ncbi:hypothetical protein C0993_004746 [Termitomyces sp. T159_Od127]|nr:hypothetical protein C0993_004746 [Termitomyces sp. T159_Od127]
MAVPSSPASQSSSQTRSATPFSEAEWPPSELHRDDTPPSSPRPASSPPTPPSPLETLSIVHETMLASSSPQLEDVSRKVPRPPQPFKSDRLLAEPIILAPDSDLSLSQSQSQSQSQPVVLSQLSQHERPPSLQVARKTHSRRRVEEAANLKEFIKAKLDGIGRAEEAGAVSWEMLYGILVETARDRGAVE